MTALQVVGVVVLYTAIAFLAFRAGCGWTMAAIRHGAKWQMSYEERVEFDRLMEKALAKRGEE